MKNLITFSLIILFSLVTLAVIAQNEDMEGCKDHPMLSRMPNFHISSCAVREFDAFVFPVENTTDDTGKKQSVEGKYTEIYYHINEGAPEPSPIQVFRNYENALKQAGITIVAKVVEAGNSYSFITARAKKGNNETWVLINSSGSEYILYFIEKQAMEQVVQATEMFQTLNQTGFIALDILFDTGKATIKPESLPLIDQIYELLKNNPALKAGIEGHTDNTGDPQSNKALSESRAKAVVAELVKKGITSGRLVPKGWGQEMPVADNRLEEGRAKNRRVEIVKL